MFIALVARSLCHFPFWFTVCKLYTFIVQYASDKWNFVLNGAMEFLYWIPLNGEMEFLSCEFELSVTDNRIRIDIFTIWNSQEAPLRIEKELEHDYWLLPKCRVDYWLLKEVQMITLNHLWHILPLVLCFGQSLNATLTSQLLC